MASSELEPIQRSPVYEQVVERLQAFIDARRLKPGDRLPPERELAEQLGVSRTSVRQALTALNVLGLLESRHGDGIYLLEPPASVVSPLASEIVRSQADHPMIWEVREGIEVQAARLAALRRTEEDVAEMRAALAAMRDSLADGGDGVEGDRRFHRAVAAAAHNELLAKMVDEMAPVIDRTSLASLTIAGRPPMSLAGHAAILDAIERGDQQDASDRMREHITASAQLVVGNRSEEPTADDMGSD